MGRRYVKRLLDNKVFQTQEEEFFPVAKAQEIALKQGGVLEDYEIGVETEEKINQWLDEQAEQAKTYSDRRKESYPSIPEQLDYIYHNGIEKWKTDMILPVKDKYPKGAE